MKFVSKVIRLLTAVCIALPVMVSGSSGAVLCFGTDGHVALEMPHSQSCSNGKHADKCEGTVFTQAADDEEHCVDVSLSLDTMSHHSYKTECPALLTNNIFTLSSIYFSAPGIDSGTGESTFLFRGYDLKTSHVLLVQKTTVIRV
jgi:hypothetical protein